MPLARVSCDGAPRALGPYSQAVVAGGFVFCSGQLGIDASTGLLAEGIEGQTEQALRNLAAVLGAAGAAFGDVVRTTVFLTDAAHFRRMNDVYARFAGGAAPARATVIVAGLPMGGAVVEIDAVAVLSPPGTS